MTDETQLRLQIQQEIDREAKIDRLIEAKVKKNLKENRQFYRVDHYTNCDANIIYCRDDLTRWYIRLSHEDNYPIEDLDKVTYVYIKNKNKHDSSIIMRGLAHFPKSHFTRRVIPSVSIFQRLAIISLMLFPSLSLLPEFLKIYHHLN